MPRSCNRVAGSIAPSPCLAYRGGRYYTSWADYQNDRGNPRGVVPGGATGPGNQIGDITCYTNCATPPTNAQDPGQGSDRAGYNIFDSLLCDGIAGWFNLDMCRGAPRCDVTCQIKQITGYNDIVSCVAHASVSGCAWTVANGVGMVIVGGKVVKVIKDANEIARLTQAAEGGSLGSTGRTVARNLKEQLAMQEAMSNPAAGTRLALLMNDSRWPAADGWVKMAQNINGVEIHYVRNTITGAVDDFKFVG
jgi:hypothetical protein